MNADLQAAREALAEWCLPRCNLPLDPSDPPYGFRCTRPEGHAEHCYLDISRVDPEHLRATLAAYDAEKARADGLEQQNAELHLIADNSPPEGWLPTWDLELEDEDEIHGGAVVTLWVSPFDGKHTKYVGVASDEPYVFFWAIHFGINPSEVSRTALTGDAPTARAAMIAADTAAKATP